MSALLEVRELTKNFGGLLATDRCSLDVRESEVHAVIGPNGAGKTTLLAQIAGEIAPLSGSIRFRGEEIIPLSMPARVARGIARSYQITTLFFDFTVEDNVALAIQAREGSSFRFWQPARSDPRLREPAREILARFGLLERAERIVATLGHAEQRTLEIAVALATAPSLFLLDEPMAGMGGDESARMVELLHGLRGSVTMVLVEHDLDVVFALADRITVLVLGRAIATGSPAEIRANPEVQRAYLGATEL